MRSRWNLRPGGGKLRLGLDVGNAAIKAVALVSGPRGARLHAAGIEPVPQPASDIALQDRVGTAIETLGRLLEAMHLTPPQIGRLATCVGGANVTVGEFEMPRMPPRELSRAVPWEARKHMPDEGRVFDFEIREERSADKVRIMLASVPQAQLDEHLAILRGVGLEPERVEPSAVALALACRGLLRGTSPHACVLLDVGASGTSLVIGQESGPFFCRFLDVGLASRSLVPALAEANEEAPVDANPSAGMHPHSALLREAQRGEGPLVEELVLEVRRSMVFFGSHYGADDIERVVLAGGGASEDLARVLGNQLGIAVTRFGYRGNQAVPRLEPMHAVAYGLVVRLGR